MHALDRENLNAGWKLPVAYGRDIMVLLPRDPYWLFTYWEVTPALWQDMRNRYGPEWDNGKNILRLYDLDYNTVSDTEIDIGNGSWHVSVLGPDHAYRVQLGRMLPGHRFVQLLSSNTVRTPRNTLSPVLDPRWRMFAFWKYRFFRRMVVGLSSFELFNPEILRRDYEEKEANRD